MIYEKLHVIDAKLNKILKLISSQENLNISEESDCEEPFNFKRIKTVSEFINFEKSLKERNYANNLLKKISKQRNLKKYRNNQRRLAYKIIDLFTRRGLYCNFSWSGKKSRNGQKNICFEKHSVFIRFILKTIREFVREFDSYELDNIFQSLCRNKNSQNNSDCSSESYNGKHK